MPITKERPRFDELQDTTGACRPLEYAVSELLRWQKNNQITGIDRVKYLLTKWPVEGGLVLSNGANLHTLIGFTPESTRELEEVGWERYLWRTGTHLEWKPKKQIMAVSVGKRKMEIFLGETEWGKGTSSDFYRPTVTNFSQTARLVIAGLMVLDKEMFTKALERGILVADSRYPEWRGMVLPPETPQGRNFCLFSPEGDYAGKFVTRLSQMMNWEKKPVGVIAL